MGMMINDDHSEETAFTEFSFIDFMVHESVSTGLGSQGLEIVYFCFYVLETLLEFGLFLYLSIVVLLIPVGEFEVVMEGVVGE